MLQLHNIDVIRDEQSILSIGELSIPTDKVTVILGHNGSGKSTLMKLLARQMTPNQGQISLNNQLLNNYSQRALAREIAFLPQLLPEVAGLNVRELVLQGRYPWRGLFGRWQESDYQIVDESMAKTDVSVFHDHLMESLSGGEKQRAWVAMLLAQQAPLLMLDEPTSALDLSHQYELMKLLKELNQQEGVGVVVILHDINLAFRYADRVLALKGGLPEFWGAPSELMNESKLSALYGIDIRLGNHPIDQSPVAVVA